MEQIQQLGQRRRGGRRFLLRLRGVDAALRHLVVANPFSPHPVTSAMFLVLTIISMSGLFLLLHAFFLAACRSSFTPAP